MTGPVPAKHQPWLAIGVVWAVAFGVVHLSWATGSRFGLVEAAAADEAFEHLWFRAYNLGVMVASFVVAAASLARLRGFTGRSGRLAHAMILLAAVVLLLRGVVGAGQLLWVSFFSVRTDPLLAWGVDLYMVLGGLILLAAARFSQAPPASGRPRPARRRASG